MNAVLHKATSRPLGVAESLLRRSIDPREIYRKHVVLIGEDETLATNNGQWCFLNSVRLLSRIAGHLTVVVPPGMVDLHKKVTSLCSTTWSIAPPSVLRKIEGSILESSDAILNVGTQVRSDLPWTVINSNGWVARMSSTAGPIRAECDQANPLGALLAASFGAAEVFKRLLSVPSEMAPPIDSCEFSLFDLTTTNTTPGPVIPQFIHMPDALMVGGGAIGNGIGLLFSQLPLRGRVHIIDKQHYADENFGTCVLLEKESWIKEAKATRLADWLNKNSSLHASGERELIERAISGDHVRALDIDLVINGLDDVGARRTSQRLWPSVIVDGGINEVGAAVIQHRLSRPEELACLQCWFDDVARDERALQAEWTGLHISSLTNLNRSLTEEDIQAASEDKREWLRDCLRRGKTVCSIITEAQLESRLGIKAENGFRASVPFVATASAALVVAEVLKALLFPRVASPSLFQLGNLFLGPEASVAVRRVPAATCTCTIHRTSIQNMHRQRQLRAKQKSDLRAFHE